MSLYQRFKKACRQYGKILIAVHLITSGVQFGAFYYAAIEGVSAIPFLELLGLPDRQRGDHPEKIPRPDMHMPSLILRQVRTTP